MNKIYKWILDNIIWNILDKPITRYKEFKCWLYCDAMNPYHWKLVKYCLFNNRPWSDYYAFEVLKIQLQKQLYYFDNVAYLISDKRKSEVIKYLNLAIKLIDILNENITLWDYEIGEYSNINDLFKNSKYTCKVYVNTRNYERFALMAYDYSNTTGTITKLVKCDKYLLDEPHELYKLKAKNLLLHILYDKSDLWWD